MAGLELVAVLQLQSPEGKMNEQILFNLLDRSRFILSLETFPLLILCMIFGFDSIDDCWKSCRGSTA